MASKHQQRVIKQYQNDGWIVVKLIKTTMNGIPDLMCLKDGKAIFVECKEKNDKLSELQKYRIDQLQKAGFEAFESKSNF